MSGSLERERERGNVMHNLNLEVFSVLLAGHPHNPAPCNTQFPISPAALPFLHILARSSVCHFAVLFRTAMTIH